MAHTNLKTTFLVNVVIEKKNFYRYINDSNNKTSICFNYYLPINFIKWCVRLGEGESVAEY